MVKDKFMSAAKASLAGGAAGGFGFCSVTFGWDMHDTAYAKELKISNLANGYRDLIARIDLNTYRRTPTTPSLPFFLITFIEPDNGETLSACPRGTLQRVIKELTDEGLEAYAGAEVGPPPPTSAFVLQLTLSIRQYEYFQFKVS